MEHVVRFEGPRGVALMICPPSVDGPFGCLVQAACRWRFPSEDSAGVEKQPTSWVLFLMRGSSDQPVGVGIRSALHLKGHMSAMALHLVVSDHLVADV